MFTSNQPHFPFRSPPLLDCLPLYQLHILDEEWILHDKSKVHIGYGLHESPAYRASLYQVEQRKKVEFCHHSNVSSICISDPMMILVFRQHPFFFLSSSKWVHESLFMTSILHQLGIQNPGFPTPHAGFMCIMCRSQIFKVNQLSNRV